MRRVNAQFRPRWRPGQFALASLAVLTACTVAALGVGLWEHQRVVALQARLAQLVEGGRTGTLPPARRPTPPYDASARQLLRERSAGWAPMLRTLENGAMIGVTPTSVEFNARDGVAQVQLNYVDTNALLDYLNSINDGVSPGQGTPRWTLIESREQAAPAQAQRQDVPPAAPAHSIAMIRSSWLAERQPGSD
jgi:hypothetical protein